VDVRCGDAADEQRLQPVAAYVYWQHLPRQPLACAPALCGYCDAGQGRKRAGHDQRKGVRSPAVNHQGGTAGESSSSSSAVNLQGTSAGKSSSCSPTAAPAQPAHTHTHTPVLVTFASGVERTFENGPQTHEYVFMHACMHACTYVCMCVSGCTYRMYVFINIRMYLSVCNTHTNTLSLTHKCTHTHTHTHTHMCVCVCVHVCVCVCACVYVCVCACVCRPPRRRCIQLSWH
jgi:hypothetical protein